MKVGTEEAARLLLESDNIVILTHRRPDGDTLGSGFALLWALESLGKTARVENADGFPDMYGFLYGDYQPADFEARYIVSVDVASSDMLGGLEQAYGGGIDLCIDHHLINTLSARHKLIDSNAPAAAQILCRVIEQMGAQITKAMANAIFTGLTTDTGCFMYDSVTAETHLCAADMIGRGAEHGMINKLMFDTKTRGRLEIEKLMMERLEYYFEERCALVSIPLQIVESLGVTDAELDGISAFPRKIAGVIAGVTMRESVDGSFHVSLRTSNGVDASKICMRLGGGGHHDAAGCTVSGPLEEAKRIILREIEEELP